ncbi:unnamed protein product [Periconia digitata]|uniref:Uncharacterized protein n=1 Tax=Periconia digitata TaxID=1303443 RepID=A0A9W4UQC0_9PLEO|nr:unnamed protein product [Periconia digitata]
MPESLHQFIEEKLRLALTGDVPGSQIDGLITNLTTLFKTLRPTLTPSEIFLAITRPTICGDPYCLCSNSNPNDDACKLDKYNITIFVDRRERGRRVTKPWVRASSTSGFEDAVGNLMGVVDGMVGEKDVVEGKGEDVDRGEVEEGKIRRERSETCLVEIMWDGNGV